MFWYSTSLRVGWNCDVRKSERDTGRVERWVAPGVAGLLQQLRCAEEERDLYLRRLRRVRSVDAVALDTRGEQLADGPFGGVGGIGRAHGVAPLLDGVLGFEHHHHHGSFGHEFHERAKKRPVL